MARLLRTTFAVVLAATALLPTLWCKPASAATTVGSLNGGPNFDQCEGCLFIVNQAFSGGPVTSWSFLATNSTSTVTPVLLNLSGNTFTISAIGTAESGGGTFGFGLVSGINNTGPSTYFGFIENNWNGPVPFYYTASPSPGTYFFTSSSASLVLSGTVGDGFSQLSDRVYSVEATDLAVTTPLPGALPLLASGLGAMGLLGWRRKRKRASAD